MEKKKPNMKGKTKFPKRNVRSKVEDGRMNERTYKDNDPSWYLVNGQLASDVANFSYNLATGERIHLEPDITTGSGLRGNDIRFPGICAIHTAPSIGISNSPTSPINVAARNIYSFVRHANSGHANYDTPDLMLYLLAADSVQTFWSYMVRAYGVARVYSQTNRYIGDALLTAMGLDPASVRLNMAQLRAYINQFAIKASVLAVPNTMTYFLRHQWMYQNVYMDEDNSKAQLYLYVPAYVYKYGLDPDTSAGCLTPKWVCDEVLATGKIAPVSTSMGVPYLTSLGNELLDAMLTQEDVGIISGDILKAYGSDKLYRFAQVPDEYAIAPVFSEEVLAQFHNTDLIGNYVAALKNIEGTITAVVDPDTALTIKQNVGISGGDFNFNPYIVGTAWNTYGKFIDFWKQDVTPEMSLVASRNKVHATLVNYPAQLANGNAFQNFIMALDTCGSELCFDAVIYQYDSLNNMLISIGTAPTGVTATVHNGSVVATASKFNQFPLLYGVTAGFYNMPVGSMSNYTVISGNEVAAMHNAALLSLFGVPYRW